MSESATQSTRATDRPRVVIVGGGFVGLTIARRLQRRFRRGSAELVLVDPSPSMTYRPFLAEVAAGSIEPRHAAVPLRDTLRRTRVVSGRVTDISCGRRELSVALADGTSRRLHYDELVLAPGAVARAPSIPGLADHAVGFTTLREARWLRDSVLGRVSLAGELADPERRRAALTVVVIGGGYSGVEAVAELQGLAATAARRLPGSLSDSLRFVLVEASDSLLPEQPGGLGARARRSLERSGVEVVLGTEVRAVFEDAVELSDGRRIPSGIVVWAGGVRANPLMSRLGLPTDPHGRLRTSATLRVEGTAHVWAAGDGAAVPDLSTPGGDDPAPVCAATAQHAVRQGRVLARNLLVALRGGRPVAYRHHDAGTVASLGLHRGVARVYGVPLGGLPAWLVHRGYHLAMVPTWRRKVRVALGWLGALASGRDLTAPELPADQRWPSGGSRSAGGKVVHR